LTSSWGFSLAAHGLFAGRTLVFADNPRERLHMIGLYQVDAMVLGTDARVCSRTISRFHSVPLEACG
jgi:hypothetical protein